MIHISNYIQATFPVFLAFACVRKSIVKLLFFTKTSYIVPGPLVYNKITNRRSISMTIIARNTAVVFHILTRKNSSPQIEELGAKRA